MAHIDYFYTLLSPFTYMAKDRLEQIAEARYTVLKCSFHAIRNDDNGKYP